MTLTARYSLETVSVTGTVAVVVPAASAPVERENTSARASKNAGMVFRFIKPAFLRQGQPPQREPPAAVLWFIRLAVGFFSYAAVSHSTMNTTFATVAPVTAEDAVQETFVKAYRSLNRFRGESCEKTWLIRIAINVCRDIQRTAWFKNLGRMVNLDDVKIPQEMKVKSEVVDQIMRMPKKLREVVLLYYYEDMSQSEIAEVLGVSVTTVHRRLDKAREALRALLEGGDELHA